LYGGTFSKREVPPPNLSPQEFFTPRYQVKAKIQPEYKWRLIEEYGPESFSVLPEGTLLLAFGEGIRKKMQWEYPPGQIMLQRIWRGYRRTIRWWLPVRLRRNFPEKLIQSVGFPPEDMRNLLSMEIWCRRLPKPGRKSIFM
jgi:hypothetical protein